MQINADTTVNFVIGNPVKHSHSPILHQKIYEHVGINAVLLAIDNPDLTALINSIKTLGVQLTAVTLPFKTSILEHIDVCSDAVKALGAANTVILKEGFLHAYNTDVIGIKLALQDVDLDHKNILIIGAGGAARAVAYALKDKQSALFFMNRTQARAKILADHYSGVMVCEDDLNHLDIDIIINTTSVGMFPHTQASPLPYYEFKAHQTVFDLIYTPKETRLLYAAKAAGARCISGETLFIEQALAQVELCYGLAIDRRVCNELLNH